jgi:hypothetical protein
MNVQNLMKNENDKNSLTISMNYNLLDNDGANVRWENGNIRLIKPYGLSNLSEIKFRNFKGDLLPYTNLKLPNLKFGVSMTSNTVNEANINSSMDSLYGDNLSYNRSNRYNNVFTIDKAWTYSAEEDDQLMYNIIEGVDMVNKRMKMMYPMSGLGHTFGIPDDTPQIFSSTTPFFNNNAGSYPLMLPSEKNVEMYYPTPENSENLIRIGSNQWFPYIAAINYNKSLSFIWFERTVTPNLYGSLDVYYNTQETPSWTYINTARWEDHTTTNNKFGINPRSPSFSFGAIPGKDCVVCSPLVTRYHNSGAYVAIFTSTHRYLLDFRSYCGDEGILYVSACYTDPDDPISFLMWVNYDLDNNAEGRMYRIGIFKVNMSDLSTDVNNPTLITSSNVVCETSSSRDGMYLTWNISDKMSTCGKECYGLRKIMREGMHIGYMFDGVGYILKTGGLINDYKKLYGWKVDDDYMYLWNGDKVLINTAPVDIVMYGYTAVGEMPAHGPVYLLGATGGLLQNPKYSDFSWPQDAKPLNPDGVLNALHASDTMLIDLNGVADNNEIQLSHTSNGKATTDSPDFFKITPDGKIQTTQLVFDTKSLAFGLHIWTEPYYFDIITPCQYYVSPTFSIIHPIFDLSYTWLNSHVEHTLETLILLMYEFNDLALRCPIFPNTDGIVFNINEESMVEFKLMAINNTIDSLTVQLISENKNVDIEELRRIYGKLSLSVDWCQ